MKKFIYLLLFSSLFVVACNNTEEVVTSDADTTQFISSELGLSFEYPTTGTGGEKINVKIDGNMVILSEGAYSSFTHEIEILDMTKDSAKESIEALFVGTTADKCEVAEFEGPALQSGIQMFEARVTDTSLGLDYDCGTYVRNGIAFFLVDEKAPSRMMFVSIGQDTFMTDTEWWKTIRLEDAEEL